MLRRVYSVHVYVKESVRVYVQESIHCTCICSGEYTLYMYMLRRVYVYMWNLIGEIVNLDSTTVTILTIIAYLKGN